METKTCKICKDVKSINLFKKGIRSTVCKKCQDQREKAYDQKRSKSEVEALSDNYIRTIIRGTAKRKGIAPVITPEIIKERRISILMNKKIKTNTLEKGLKECKVCKKITDLAKFPKHKNTCYSCKNKIEYSKYKHKKIRCLYTNDVRKRQLKKEHSNKELLSDVYIKKLLVSTLRHRIYLTTKDISQDFVELKRKELTIKRQIK